ncbi:hypothetical protein PVAP13_4NG141111 [Panicum virgatum]|uniref:Uncharacterized protein n=1 Tax=Panicum virgatum TaxID=38727 RepID=A0A8T0TE55_PANVG|nr:hypothetical protein PVAP13_4NG141111 [Panicum virgatum]
MRFGPIFGYFSWSVAPFLLSDQYPVIGPRAPEGEKKNSAIGPFRFLASRVLPPPPRAADPLPRAATPPFGAIYSCADGLALAACSNSRAAPRRHHRGLAVLGPYPSCLLYPRRRGRGGWLHRV